MIQNNMNSAQKIRETLWSDRGRTPHGNAKIAPCPRLCPNPHDDVHPSFSVSDKNGKVLFHCLASRCTQAEAQEGLKNMGLWGESKNEEPDLPEIFPKELDDQQAKEWVYRDNKGIALAIHGRWDTPTGKVIRWRLPHGTYREGLGETETKTFPLYGSELVEQKPNVPVVFCEGESAVDACRENGLLAVTNAGGASQVNFGTALEVLRNRDVQLWPDNDPPGRRLMSTIQQQLRPIAKSVRILQIGKELPYKGDAVQFFGDLNGTVNDLNSYSEPTIEHLSVDQFLITLPLQLEETKGVVKFLFDNLVSGRGGLKAQVTITPPISAIHTENYEIKRKIDLLSSSSISSLIRDAKNAFAELDWPKLIPQAISLASKGSLDSEDNAAFDLAASMDQKPQAWMVEKILPANVNTIMFGTGGSLKTLALHSLAIHVALGASWGGHKIDHSDANVMILDYESTLDIWMREQRRLVEGMPGGEYLAEGRIKYLAMRGIALADQMDRVLRMVRKHNIKFIIIDSAALACGGDPIDTYVVTSYFNSLQRLNELGVTTITIAHVTKESSRDNDKSTQRPYGSVYWENSARATYYIEKEQAENRTDFYTITFKCRKINLGYPPPDFTLDVLFKDPEGLISVVEGDPIE